ncbi:MAG: hypothetical protein LQ347_001728 [Umbilicaria vellea]|nr:MAG: hypothetical protein LQ347_001728 [Umbilicaria vellea]
MPSRALDIRFRFSPNNLTLAFLGESLTAPTPFGPPSFSAVAAESSFMPMIKATSSFSTAYEVSTSVNVGKTRALRLHAPSLLETGLVDVEKLRYGLNEGETPQVIQDQGPANGRTLGINTPSTPKARRQRPSGGQASEFPSSGIFPVTGGGVGTG